MQRELVMGINAVAGLLEVAPERIVRVWIRPGSERLKALEKDLRAAGMTVELADDRALGRLAGRVRHQGVIAEFVPRRPGNEQTLHDILDRRDDKSLFLVLDGVQDPNNLGACLRTAAAAGVTAVIIPDRRAAGMTPAARRAAAGAAEMVELIVVVNLARCLRLLADYGVWCIGLDSGSGNSVFSAGLKGPLAVVLGSEEDGLRRLTGELCDELLEIPMPGPVESLNVSVAAGIALFSALQQRSDIS